MVAEITMIDARFIIMVCFCALNTRLVYARWPSHRSWQMTCQHIYQGTYPSLYGFVRLTIRLYMLAISSLLAEIKCQQKIPGNQPSLCQPGW